VLAASILTALAMTAAASMEAVMTAAAVTATEMTAAMTAAVLTVVASTVPDLHELRARPRCGDEPEERRVGLLAHTWPGRTPGRLERR